MGQSNSFARYPSLKDRVVLVTGGGSGIGASIVEQFALQGSLVAFLDVAEDSSRELVRELTPRAAHAPLFLHCDLTDIDALRAAVAKVDSELGPPRVLVNNAANDDRHKFTEVTPAYWDQKMAINLRHQYFTTQAVAPLMKAAGGGSVINLSSIAWKVLTADMSVYTAAKAAIVGMTRGLAEQLAVDDIRINCVLPGAILTERQRRLWYTPEYEELILSRQCLKRHLMPEEVARLVLFLASDDSSAMTGQEYLIDGGWA